MPYIINKKGNKWVVKTATTGRGNGTHDTEKKAHSQLARLLAIGHKPDCRKRN